MYQDVSGQFVSLIYLFILSIVYFLKRKYNFLESKFYKSLLVSTIISIILDIGCVCLLTSEVNSTILVNTVVLFIFLL